MHYLMIVLVLLVSIISAVTDIKSGKIYNRLLLPFSVLGLVFLVLYFTKNQELASYLINLFIGSLLSIVLYKSKVWGAGDSKLWIFICAFLPFLIFDYNTYILYPSMYIFIYTFLFAYIYVISDTLLQLLRKRQFKAITFSKKGLTKDRILIFISVYFMISIVYGLLTLLLEEYFIYNRLWISIFVILLLNSKINFYIERFKRYYFAILATVYILVLALQVNLFDSPVSVNYHLGPIIVWLVVITIRLISSDFNYDEINTKDVVAGMVLSKSSVANFTRSRIKGLPLYTDESTKFRITEPQAAAIKKWENSKYGNETIVVVRHIPFAIFISLGLILFLALNWGLIING